MRGGKIIFVILLLILSPIIIVFLMGSIGTLLGTDSQGVNAIIVGIAILCDLIIACTLIIVSMLQRLIGMNKTKDSSK